MIFDYFSLGVVMFDTAQQGAVDTKHTRYDDQKKSEFRNEEVKMWAVFLELRGLLHTLVKGPHFTVYCKYYFFLFFWKMTWQEI